MRLGYSTDACMTADALYQAEMEVASALMLDVLRGKAPAPRGLRWQTQSGGSGGIGYYAAHIPKSAERDRMAEQLRTARDACPRCAARGDFDCGHAPVIGGRLVCL